MPPEALNGVYLTRICGIAKFLSDIMSTESISGLESYYDYSYLNHDALKNKGVCFYGDGCVQ